MSAASIKKHHTRYFHVVWALEALAGVKGNGSAGPSATSLSTMSSRPNGSGPSGSPPRVLDIGCGRGGITTGIKKNRPNLGIFACDKDESQINSFKKKYKHLDIKIEKCDAQRLIYRNASFDAVTIFDVLEHLESPQKAVSESARVLKEGGLFHLVVPLERELTTLDGWIKKLFGVNLKKSPIGHIQQFTLKEVKSILEKAGFAIVRIRFSYHFFYQFFSLIYFLFVAVFRRGKYLPLAPKRGSLNKFISWLTALGGWLVFLESSVLRKVRGQTAHITAKRI